MCIFFRKCIDVPKSKYLPAAMEFEEKCCGFSMLCYELSDEDSEIVEILAPLTENPNALNKDGLTPLYWAAFNSHTEIMYLDLSAFDRQS